MVHFHLELTHTTLPENVRTFFILTMTHHVPYFKNGVVYDKQFFKYLTLCVAIGAWAKYAGNADQWEA